jgi:TRAP-type C4-dicarboxylate transport system substrate-binding protein
VNTSMSAAGTRSRLSLRLQAWQRVFFPVLAIVVCTATLFVVTLGPVSAAQWPLLEHSAASAVTAQSVSDFSAAVRRTSRGSIEIGPAPAGAKVTADRLLSDLSAGRIDLARVSLATLEAFDPVVALDRVPYLATNFIDAAKLWQVLQPYVRDVLKSKGVTLLYAVPQPPRSPLSRKPMIRLSGWRGSTLVMGAPALTGFARAVGAIPAADGKVRELLKDGRADVVFESASSAVRDKAWEFATDFLQASAWFPKELVLANSRKLADLTAAERDALFLAADVAGREAWSLAARSTEDSVQMLRDYGIKTHETPVNVLIQLETLGRDLLFQWSGAAGESGAKLVEAYYAIR